MGLDPALIDAINAVKQRGIISTSELHKLWVVQDFAGVHGGSLRGGAKFGEDFNLLRLSRAAVWHMKAFGGLSMMFEGGCGGVKPVKKFGDVRQAGIDGKVSIEASWGAHGLEAAFGQICAETLSALKQMFGPNIELLLCPSEGDPAAANRYDALLASGYHTPTFHLDRSSKRPTKRRKSDESGASTPSGDGQDDDDGSDDEEEPLDFDGIDEDKPFESLDEVLAFVAAWEETRDQEETSKRLPTVTISVPGDGLGALIHALDSDFMNLLRLGSNVMTRLRPIGRSRNRARIEWYNTRDAWQHYAVTQRATVEHWITADKGASSPSALSSQSSRFEEELESFMIILHSKSSTTSSATSNTGVGSTSSNVLVDPLGDLHSSLVASGQGMPLPLLERLVLGALVNGALWRDYTPLTETRVGVGQLSTLKMCIVAGSLYATYRVLRQYGFEFVGGRRSFGRSIVYTMGHHGQVVSWDARLPIVTFRPNLGPGMAQLVTSLLSFADSSFNPPLKDYTFPTTPELSNLSTVLAAAPSPILPVPSFPNAETIWRLTVFLRVLPASGMYAADARALVGSAIPGTPLLKSVHLDLFSSSVWDVVGCGKLAPVAREVWKAFIELGQQVGVSQATKFIRWEKADEREEVVDRYELRLEREGLLEDEEDYSEYYTPESFEARRTEMANAIEAKRALLDERKQRHAQVISDLAAELASARGVAPLSQHVLDDLLAPRDQIRDDIVDEVAKIVKDVLKPESPLVFSEGKLTFLSDDFHRDERFVLGRKGRDYTYIGEKASLLLRRLAPELDIIVESKWEHRARALVRCGGIVTGLLTRRSLPRLIVYVRASRGLAPTLLHLIRDGVWSATAPDYATIKQHLSSPCDECEGNKEDKAYFGRIMYISRDLIRKLPANSLALPTVPTNPRLEQRLVKKAIVEAAELAQQLAFTEPELDAVGRTTMGTVRSEKACEAIGIARLEVRTVGQPATGWRRNIHLWMRLQREVEWRVEGDRDAMRRAMGPLIDEVKTAAPKEEGGGAGERAIFEGAKW